jgi:hypothetical protein
MVNKAAVSCLIPSKNGKPCWLRIGTAEFHADGTIDVELDTLPVNGRMTIPFQACGPTCELRKGHSGAHRINGLLWEDDV